eukprot:14800315-Alexandrium_andersonii.AAC.1
MPKSTRPPCKSLSAIVAGGGDGLAEGGGRADAVQQEPAVELMAPLLPAEAPGSPKAVGTQMP